MSSLIGNVIGTLAALCSMASFTPQVVKLYREKDGSAISLPMYVVTVIGFSLWVAYGLVLRSWPLVVSNGVCVALSAAILVLKVHYSAKRRADV